MPKTVTILTGEDELYHRAVRAYYLNARRHNYVPQQPAAARSGLETLEDKDYMVLRNHERMLAVYRVRKDGIMKLLRRPPKALLNGEAADV